MPTEPSLCHNGYSYEPELSCDGSGAVMLCDEYPIPDGVSHHHAVACAGCSACGGGKVQRALEALRRKPAVLRRLHFLVEVNGCVFPHRDRTILYELGLATQGLMSTSCKPTPLGRVISRMLAKPPCETCQPWFFFEGKCTRCGHPLKPWWLAPMNEGNALTGGGR